MMAGKPFIEIANLDTLASRYRNGETVAQICEGTDLPCHTLRRRFVALGIMRGVSDGTRMAYKMGRMANRRTRAGVPQSEEAKRKQSETMRRKADVTARGWRINSNGYVEFTRKDDPNCGRHEHTVVMERHIGRRLNKGECVHHIDGDRTNNSIDNLALMTVAAHARLHRLQEKLTKGN